MESFKLISDVSNMRIDLYISKQLTKYSRSFVQKLIDENNVTVNEKTVKTNYKLKLNDIIKISVPEPKKLDVIPQAIDIDVVYEDDDIIIVNKQKDMVVHPAVGNYDGTLVNALLSYCDGKLSDINGVIRPGIVHRIDKDTTGILVVAKNNIAHEKLSELFKVHDIKRKYVAIVEGVIKIDAGVIDAPIGRHPNDRKRMAINVKNGRNAITHFKVLERFAKQTLVELTLETGRTHQIRVHMASIGYPVMGDLVYGKKNRDYPNLKGQVLHAKILGFIHPTTGKYVEFEGELPQYFKELITSLRQ